MTPSEDVLRDLLLEHGIDGVTLWHIKALAAYLQEAPSSAAWLQLRDDLRGEDAVSDDAITEDMERTANCKHKH